MKMITFLEEEDEVKEFKFNDMECGNKNRIP